MLDLGNGHFHKRCNIILRWKVKRCETHFQKYAILYKMQSYYAAHFSIPVNSKKMHVTRLVAYYMRCTLLSRLHFFQTEQFTAEFPFIKKDICKLQIYTVGELKGLRLYIN